MHTPADVVHAYFAALNTSDPDGIVALFTDDAVLMADDFDTAAGSAQIRALFEGAFAAMSMQRELHLDRVVEDSELAVIGSHSTGTTTLHQSGATIDETNRELYVLRHSTDGWRIAEYMFNSLSAAAQ